MATFIGLIIGACAAYNLPHFYFLISGDHWKPEMIDRVLYTFVFSAIGCWVFLSSSNVRSTGKYHFYETKTTTTNTYTGERKVEYGTGMVPIMRDLTEEEVEEQKQARGYNNEFVLFTFVTTMLTYITLVIGAYRGGESAIISFFIGGLVSLIIVHVLLSTVFVNHAGNKLNRILEVFNGSGWGVFLLSSVFVLLRYI